MVLNRSVQSFFGQLLLYSNDDESFGGENNDENREIPFMSFILCTAMMTRALEERRTMMTIMRFLL
jgi:hypothetical protein